MDSLPETDQNGDLNDPDFEKYFPGLVKSLQTVPELMDKAKQTLKGASTHDLYPEIAEKVFEPHREHILEVLDESQTE